MVDTLVIDNPALYEIDQRRHQLQKQNAPVPLPQKRPRALTLPLLMDRWMRFLWKKQITRNQLQSPFFKLPLEVRQLVYEYVFSIADPDVIISVWLGVRDWDKFVEEHETGGRG